MPDRNPNSARMKSMTGSMSFGASSGSGRRMPLGWPVVPDE
jgi:hypothetical protein